MRVLTPGRLLGLVAGGAFLADVATKTAADHALRGRPPVRVLGPALQLEYSRNPGAAFGIAGSATLLLTAVALAVVVVVLAYARRVTTLRWAAGLGLILGGALGNLADRIGRAPGWGRGTVVDWIAVPHWPTFDLADSAIMIGAACVVLLSRRETTPPAQA